jgi:hypothetical protein
MSEAHERAHKATEISDKKIALLIAVLALFLAFAETGAKSTQTEVLATNIEASDLWAFYQAKSIRETTLRTAVEMSELSLPAGVDPVRRATFDKRLEDWRDRMAHLQSDPKSNEGRKELSARAKHAEAKRDKLLASNHQFEISSAAFQIAIVLASATVITGVAVLGWLAGGLGLLGLAFMALALLAPTAIAII